MSPQTIIARTDAAIAGYGQSVTLQRTTSDPSTGAITIVASVDCPAKFRQFSPQDLQAGEARDIHVVISGPSLGSFGPPKRDDRVIINGDQTEIQQIELRVYGGILCRVDLLCRG